MKSSWLLGLFVLTTPLFAGIKHHQLGPAGASSYAVKWIVQERDRSEVEITINHFTTSELMIEGYMFQAVDLPDAQHHDDFAYPLLPKIYRDLAIPQGANVTVSIVAQDVMRMPLEPVVPSKGSLLRHQNPALVPFTIGPFYRLDGKAVSEGEPTIWPEEPVAMGEPFQFRDVNGVRLMWHPFRYDIAHKELLITKRVRLAINHPAPHSKKMVLSAHFLPFYQHHFANFNAIAGKAQLTTDTAAMLVVGTAPACALYQEKRVAPQHLGATYYYCPETLADAAEVSGMIKQTFATHADLTHVLLLGDEYQVPFFPGVSGNAYENEADPMYGMVVGDDRYPDLIVARLPFATNEQLEVMVARNNKYLATVPAPQAVVQIASEEFFLPGTPKDWERIQRYDALYPQATITHLFDPGVTTEAVGQALARGPSLVNYMGHGAVDGWYTGSYYNEAVDLLENDRFPIIHSVACVNGNFAFPFYESFAEHLMSRGTVAAPHGAIAVLASSTNQAWVPPTVGQWEANRAYAQGFVRNMADLMMYTWLGVLEDASQDAWQTVETWHLFADPLLPVVAVPSIR